MSGHSSFAPIGNNVNRAPVQQQPGVAGSQVVRNAAPTGAPVAPTAPQGPVPAEPGKVDARKLAYELDILLAKAAKSASGLLDEAAVAKIATNAKLGKATVAALRQAAKEANEALHALDTFRGIDLARAMTYDGQKQEVSWDAAHYANVGTAIETALEKQQTLSNALAKALNSLPKKATAAQQAALENAMMRCDMRYSEIETVVMELSLAVSKGIDWGDAKTAEALNRHLTDIADGKTLAMHGHNQDVEAIRSRIVPLAQALDGLAANSGAAVSKAQLTAFRHTLAEARAALAELSGAGTEKVQVEVETAEGGKTTRTHDRTVERTFLDEMGKMLDAAETKLTNLRKSAAGSMLRNFIEKDIPWLKDDLLKPEFGDAIRALAQDEAEGGCLDAVATLAENLAKARKMLLEYAEKPSRKLYNQIAELFNAFDGDVVKDCVKGFDLIIKKGSVRRDIEDPALRAAVEGFARAHVNGLESLRLELVRIAYRSPIIMDQLDDFAARIKRTDALDTSDAIRGIVMGEGSISTLVESRINGYDDSDIDPALDDRNVVSSRELGSGNFNTVQAVTFKDGTQRIFKPELAGRMAAEGTPILTGTKNAQQITRINRSVNRTADALGLGDVMVRTTAGVHKGVFGMYMETAPGAGGDRLAGGMVAASYDKDGTMVALGSRELRRLPADQKRIVHGRMMRQLNRLQWFDVITGQGDRHPGNYMVQVKPDLTVTVKGIDNDSAFGLMRTGLDTFHLPPYVAELYKNQVNDLAAAYGTKAKIAVDGVLRNDPGVKTNKDGSIDIDVSKAQSPLAIAAMCFSTGFKNVAVPDVMDLELYNRLVPLKSGPERDALLKDWADRLGADTLQYTTAVNRLDQAIARAEQLKGEGKVYSAEDWERAENQKRLNEAEPPLDPFMEVMGNRPQYDVGKLLAKRYDNLASGNYFQRDFAKFI